MQILKLLSVSHSGQGDNATHKKVIREFRKSESDGRNYCKKRGWSVQITDTTLEVKSQAVFGFYMLARIAQ